MERHPQSSLRERAIYEAAWAEKGAERPGEAMKLYGYRERPKQKRCRYPGASQFRRFAGHSSGEDGGKRRVETRQRYGGAGQYHAQCASEGSLIATNLAQASKVR